MASVNKYLPCSITCLSWKSWLLYPLPQYLHSISLIFSLRFFGIGSLVLSFTPNSSDSSLEFGFWFPFFIPWTDALWPVIALLLRNSLSQILHVSISSCAAIMWVFLSSADAKNSAQHSHLWIRLPSAPKRNRDCIAINRNSPEFNQFNHKWLCSYRELQQHVSLYDISYKTFGHNIRTKNV